MTTPAGTPTPRMPAPSGERLPLKTNVYELMRVANAQLVPLFPYFGRGAMLPAGAVFRGARDATFGRFFHRNTEEEVAICFGAQGSMARPGVMFIAGKMHEVGAPLLDPCDPDSFLVSVITQRQPDSGDQRESLIFRCSECNTKLFQYDYEATPSDADATRDTKFGGRADDAFPMFPTMWGSHVAAAAFNADPNARTCGKCGHVNDEFPEEQWGWGSWVSQHEVINAARHGLEQAARDGERGE
jgi:hypothetical protein